MLPLQPGDVPDTYAEMTDLCDQLNYLRATKVEEGIKQFFGIVITTKKTKL